MLGLTFDKILVLALLAAFVIGPTRLPDAAAQLGRFVRMVRAQLDGAKASLRDTGGPDLDDVDWKRLDPRQYDPRRIIRDALVEHPAPRAGAAAAAHRTSPAKADRDHPAVTASEDTRGSTATGPAMSPRDFDS
jgi:sec-independent protein translocase protein TatB